MFHRAMKKLNLLLIVSMQLLFASCATRAHTGMSEQEFLKNTNGKYRQLVDRNLQRTVYLVCNGLGQTDCAYYYCSDDKITIIENCEKRTKHLAQVKQ